MQQIIQSLEDEYPENHIHYVQNMKSGNMNFYTIFPTKPSNCVFEGTFEECCEFCDNNV